MKKNYFFSFLFSIISISLFAQYTVDFEDGNKSSYAQGTVTLNGIDWDMTDALIGSLANDFFNDVQSARLRGYATSSITMLQDKSNGIGNISFQYRQYGSDSQVAWRVEYSDDAGTTWNVVGTPFTATATVETFSENVQASGNIRVRIVQDLNAGAANARMNVDDIVITDFGQVVTLNDTIVSFKTITATVQEASGTHKFNFELNQAVTVASTVDVALLSGTSANLGNFTSSPVTFTAGTDTASLTITLDDDSNIEPDETYEFIIQNPSSNLTLGSDSIFTLIVQDDDAPVSTYSIASVTTVDTAGTPDSLGVACEVSGVVMGINYADAPDVSFYIHDGTGGMGVYNPMNSVGYTVSEGDQVTVKGEVGFFNGLTQMVNLISVTTSGMATLPAVTTATAPLGESTEGELVKLANVTVVDQNDWNTGMGAGFNVEVTDGTNTFSVRIDKSTDLYSMVIPGCVLDVTGIGTQFDNSSPYDEGYQLLPRYMADITVIDTCAFVAPTATSIADATEVDSDGEPLMLGSDVTLKGIITSPDFRENQNAGTEFTFSDGTGGIWAYSSDSTLSFDPIIGDSVVVSGNIGAASGVTRLFIDVVTSLGAATPFTPTVVSTSLDESHEAELITINGLKLNGAWNSSGGSYNVSATSNGITYDIRVDADRAELFQVPLTSTQTFNLTGVGSQFDPSSPRTDGYQIMPRISSDIELTTSISDLSLNNFTVSPVPASDILNIRFDYTANEEANIQLVNVIGKVVATKNVNLNNGVNTNSISVANLTSGLYILQIQTSNGVSNTNVVVK